MTERAREAAARAHQKQMGVLGGDPVNAAIDAYIAALWEPIESAPKGGGTDSVSDPNWIEPPEILLCLEKGYRVICRWDWYYAEGGDGYRDGVAWILSNGDLLEDHYPTSKPVWWMPLPTPPAETRTE